MDFLIVEELDEPVKEIRLFPKGAFQVSTIGKIMLAGIAAWMVGKASRLKVRGTQQEVSAIANALRSSRRFQDEIRKPGATAQSVIQKLNLAKAYGRDFQRILGVPWPF